MATDTDKATGTPRTNFTTVRLRHDFLRRSSIGGIFTNRSVSLVAPGANSVIGLDTSLAFYQNLFFSAYYAKSHTEGRTGNDQSYRTLFNYNADRYGLQLDRNVIEKNFNPEVGFLVRNDARRNYASVRFSPRTTKSRMVRRYTYQTDLNYITDTSNRLSTRVNTAQFQTELHNSDTFTVLFTRDYELLISPFQIARTVQLPVGSYTFQNVNVSYLADQQRRVNGTSSIEVGSFYDGIERPSPEGEGFWVD